MDIPDIIHQGADGQDESSSGHFWFVMNQLRKRPRQPLTGYATAIVELVDGVRTWIDVHDAPDAWPDEVATTAIADILTAIHALMLYGDCEPLDPNAIETWLSEVWAKIGWDPVLGIIQETERT